MKMQESHKKKEDLIQSAQTDVINVVTPSRGKSLDVQHGKAPMQNVLRRLATSVAFAKRRLRKVITVKGPCGPQCTQGTSIKSWICTDPVFV